MKEYMELIESITCIAGYENNKTKAELFDDIYMIAHIANGNCKNKHKERLKKIEVMKKDFNI